MENLMATFTEIKKKFCSLSPKEQEPLFKEIGERFEELREQRAHVHLGPTHHSVFLDLFAKPQERTLHVHVQFAHVEAGSADAVR